MKINVKIIKTVTGNENTVSQAKRTRVLLPKLYEPSDECGGGMPFTLDEAVTLYSWRQLTSCCSIRTSIFFFNRNETSAEVPIKPLLFNVFSSCSKGILLRAFGSIPAVPSRQCLSVLLASRMAWWVYRMRLRQHFGRIFFFFFCTYS